MGPPCSWAFILVPWGISRPWTWSWLLSMPSGWESMPIGTLPCWLQSLGTVERSKNPNTVIKSFRGNIQRTFGAWPNGHNYQFNSIYSFILDCKWALTAQTIINFSQAVAVRLSTSPLAFRNSKDANFIFQMADHFFCASAWKIHTRWHTGKPNES